MLYPLSYEGGDAFVQAEGTSDVVSSVPLRSLSSAWAAARDTRRSWAVIDLLPCVSLCA